MTNPRLALLAMSAAMFREAEVGATSGTGTAAAVEIPNGMKGEVFHFRKEKVLDDKGEEIGEAFKHPSVTIPLPIPTRDEMLAIFTDPARTSEQKFLSDLVYDAFYSQAREQINDAREQNKDNKEFRVTAQVIDYGKLTINALANMPASERGNKVSDEDMKAFLSEYISIMPSALDKDVSKIRAQAGLLEKGLRTVRTDKKILLVMEQCLSVWAAATTAMDEHQAVYEMLTGRIKKWKESEPKNLLSSIM